MALTTMSSAAKAATVLMLIIAASTVSPVLASKMWAYKRGCAGPFISVFCGCSNLSFYKGGYFFKYSAGRVGRLYYGFSCGGAYVPLDRDVRLCPPQPYKSVYIPC